MNDLYQNKGEEVQTSFSFSSDVLAKLCSASTVRKWTWRTKSSRIYFTKSAAY